MSDTRKKFPRIHHVVNGPLRGGGVTRDDIVLSEKDTSNFFNNLDEAFTDKEISEIETIVQSTTATNEQKEEALSRIKWSVVVLEKLDGANLGIFYDPEARALAFQNRSHRVVANSASQWKGLDKFVENVGNEILDLLFSVSKVAPLMEMVNKEKERKGMQLLMKKHNNDSKASDDNRKNDDDQKNTSCAENSSSEEVLAGEWTLYGEWLLARHSVAYDALPSPFLAFDLHHAPTDTFVSAEILKRLLTKHCPSIRMVPVLAEWHWNDHSRSKKRDDDEKNSTNKPHQQSKAASSGILVTDRFCSDGPPIFSARGVRWNQIHDAYHNKPSTFASDGTTRCEGGMIRVEVNGRLLRRCKAVHDEFRANIEEHWTAKELVKNGVIA